MNKVQIIISTCFIFALQTVFAQQKSVAVLPSSGVLGNEETEALTDRVRGAALKVLPAGGFTLLKQDVIVKRLGGAENYVKACSESSCIVDLGKKAMVDYVAQASVGKLGKQLRLKIELYDVKTEGLIDIFDNEYNNFYDLRKAAEEHVPDMFRKIPGVVPSAAPPAAPSLNAVQFVTEPPGAALEFNGKIVETCRNSPCKINTAHGKIQVTAVLGRHEKADTTVNITQANQRVAIKLRQNYFMANISTEPSGAALELNGEPYSQCPNAPCRIDFSKGVLNISAALEGYEKADTTVLIEKENQAINIKLKQSEAPAAAVLPDTASPPEPIPEPQPDTLAQDTLPQPPEPVVFAQEIAEPDYEEEEKPYRYSDYQRERAEIEKANGALALGVMLDLVGAVFIYYGITQNSKANDRHGEYRSLDASQVWIDMKWKGVETAKNKRNTAYAIGTLFLAAGIGVHIWF